MQTAKTLIRLGGAQADLSLRWADSHFVGFIMPWLKYDYLERFNCLLYSNTVDKADKSLSLVNQSKHKIHMLKSVKNFSI